MPVTLKRWSQVTLREALQHTSGLPDYSSDPEFGSYFGSHLHGIIGKPALIQFVADEPLEFLPGSAYHYSNTDNIVVALFAESATGRSYRSLLRSEVISPLKLRRTKLPTRWRIPAPKIHGYETLPVLEDLTACCSASFANASGGIVSTPRELTRFTRAYVGGELFSRREQREQADFWAGGSSDPPGPGQQSAGLGLFRYETRCGVVFGHTGNFPGYTQFTAADRSGQRGLTLTVNRQIAPGAPGEGAAELFDELHRDYTRAVCALLD